MSRVYLSLGSNSNDKAEMLEKAIALLASKLGSIEAISQTYETPAWGYESDNTYYNSAIIIDTLESPNSTLAITQAIEKELGRKIKTINGEYTDRPIDLDIIFYDDVIINLKHLVIPHVHTCERRFVLQPLNDIVPEYVHPVRKEKISVLLLKCTDNTKVVKV